MIGVRTIKTATGTPVLDSSRDCLVTTMQVTGPLTSGSPQFNGWRKQVVRVAAYVLFSIAVLCVTVMLLPASAHSSDRLLAKIALLCAAIAPPFYLWVEHCFIWATADAGNRPPLDEFRHAQETARNLWLAFAGTIIVLYFR